MMRNNRFTCVATIPVDFSGAPDSFSVAIEEKGFCSLDSRISYPAFPAKLRRNNPGRVDFFEFPPESSLRSAMETICRYGLRCLNILELVEMARDDVLGRVFIVLDEQKKEWSKVSLFGRASISNPIYFSVVEIDRSEEIIIKILRLRSLAGAIMPGCLILVHEK